MRKNIIILLAMIIFTHICAAQVDNETQPVILIYSPKSPGYGNALKELIEGDDRFDPARVRLCHTLEDFKVSMYFPDVKIGVVTLASDIQQDLNLTLQSFFGSGGGLIGMGFAGSKLASKNASENVFPIFGNVYRSPKYNPEERKFIMTLIKQEEDEISEGVSTFSIPQHKVIVYFNTTANEIQTRRPESGEYKILFSEKSTGAPAMVKYHDQGFSITFATFGGDDFHRAPSYYGLFVDEPEFKTLFTNSLEWVWNSEQRYENSIAQASRFYQNRKEHLDELQEAADRRERKAENMDLIRNISAILGAAIGCIIIYWATFFRNQNP